MMKVLVKNSEAPGIKFRGFILAPIINFNFL
jgi:hypothetical protein